MTPSIFSFGGCAYRLQLSVSHVESLVRLAMLSQAVTEWPKLGEVNYLHTSYLPQGRCLWLRGQIDENRLSYAVSCDSDTAFKAEHLLAEMSQVEGAVALGIAPVRIGGTRDISNINISARDERTQADYEANGSPIAAPATGNRAHMTELDAVLRSDRLIASGGFGLVVFNLKWFRACWPRPEPEGLTMDVGEDIAFCRSVRQRGGMIKVLAVETRHYAFGESVIR